MAQRLMELDEIGTRRVGSHGGGKRQKYVLDEVGRRLLLERYDGSTETIDDLMRYFGKLGVPRYCVRKWARDLGLSRQKEPRWTEENEAYLERTVSRRSLGAIAKDLGRTKTSVKLKAKRLGINKTQEGYTMRGLCLGLGCDHHKVRLWIERGWIKGTRRHSERTEEQGGDMWYFSDAAVRNLIKNHPCEVDPRRADWLWVVDVLVGGLGSLSQEKEGGG